MTAKAKPPTNPSQFISRVHAAYEFDCTVQLLDKHVKQGKLKAFYLGRKVLFRRETAAAFGREGTMMRLALWSYLVALFAHRPQPRYVGHFRTLDSRGNSSFLARRLALSAVPPEAAAYAGIRSMTVAAARGAGYDLPVTAPTGSSFLTTIRWTIRSKTNGVGATIPNLRRIGSSPSTHSRPVRDASFTCRESRAWIG